MKLGLMKTKLVKATLYLENILALFIIAAIVIGMTDLVKYLIIIFRTNAIDTYEILQKFLGHVLLLVVGVELVAMLVKHTPSSVIEVLLYAIARKMLIGSGNMLEFALGIVSIAGIFAIKKFLFVSSISDAEAINVFPASASISDVNSSLGLNIPEGLADTVGGLVVYMSSQSCREIHEGSYYRIADAEMKVLSYNDGVIQRVWIMRFNED